MEILSPVCYLSNTGRPDDDVSGSQWTPAENKAFENALAYFDEKMPDRWYKMAAMVPTKTLLDIIIHYKKLEFDVTSIEAGHVKIPRYSSATSSSYVRKTYFRSASEQERKKGILWTEEEHKLFLMGLKKYGKGDWRNISRNFVVTRTPTQVASHAQKYFNRQLLGGKDKRRASIHDITTVNLNENQLQGFFRHERNVSETYGA